MRLCLASTSPRRAELLSTAGLRFFICDPGVVELSGNWLPPGLLASNNARLKAEAAGKLHQDAVVIGADTVVCLGGEIFGKPPDLETAHTMLERLGGHWHEVFTAVCILPPGNPGSAGSEPVEFVECTRVLLRSFSRVARDDYFAKINPLDKAGAYAAQEPSANLVEAMEGSFSNVVGLPLEALCAALKRNFPQVFLGAVRK